MQQTKIRFMKPFIFLFAFALLLAGEPVAAQPCKPKLIITSANNPSVPPELQVGQTYDLRVTVDCFSSCEIVVEGKKAKVKALGNNVFSVTPESSVFSLDVYTVCKDGTTIETADGKNQNVAGKKLFASESYRAKKG